MSTIACDIPRSALDEPAWRALCETAAAQATKGCGLSHDYYVERFSSAIDAQLGRLPEEQRAQALKIAQEWDYATPAERQETQAITPVGGSQPHTNFQPYLCVDFIISLFGIFPSPT